MFRILFLVLVLVSQQVYSEVVEFPEEELATETVLPTFDRNVSVMNRAVVTRGRVEVGPFAGGSLFEPFYSQYVYGGYATYHFNELHAVSILGQQWLPGYTSNADRLRSVQKINFENAPSPSSMALANYQFSGWYGKLSLSKQVVINTSLYGMAGAGFVSVGGKMEPALTIGLGHKFYLTKNSGLRFDLRFVNYQAPDPMIYELYNSTSPIAIDRFPKQNVTSSFLTLGYIFLL